MALTASRSTTGSRTTAGGTLCAGRAGPRGATPSSLGFRWRVCSSRRGRAGELPAAEVLEIELAPLTTTECYRRGNAARAERRSVYGEPLR